MPRLSRRSFLAASAAPLARVSATESKRPNVLFFFPDQVRAQALGYNGGRNVATPNIDRLAAQGVSFTNATSTCPLCTPYRAMLQTGRWPTLSGGVLNWINLPPTGHSMANAFADSGYKTGYIGKWHLAAGALKGHLKRSEFSWKNVDVKHVEHEYVPPGPLRHGYQHWEAYNFHANFAHAWYYRDTPKRLFMPKYETDSETDMAIDFMRRHKDGDQPFFLVVAPHPPHPPWRKNQTPSGSLARIPERLYWRPNVKGRTDSPRKDPRCYYGMIGDTDDNVGRIMNYLDESGLADNTIFVFTSDHGEMLASQGRYNKMVPYTEAVSVPLLYRWPGHVRPGAKSDVLYTPMDHFPTLANLCGVEVPGIVNGRNLAAPVVGRRGQDPDAVLMMNFVSHWDFPETQTEWPEWRGIRTKDYTYCRWLNGPEELYDNVADPYQMRNLCDGRGEPAVLRRLRSRLKDLLHEAHDEFLSGNQYGAWLNQDRDVIRNALGPIA